MGELTLVRENHPKASRSGRVSHEHQDSRHARRGRARAATKHAEQDKNKHGMHLTSSCERTLSDCTVSLIAWDGRKAVLVRHARMRDASLPPFRNWNAQFSSPCYKAMPHGPPQQNANITGSTANRTVPCKLECPNHVNDISKHITARRHISSRPIGLAPLSSGRRGPCGPHLLLERATETERFSDSAQYDLASRPPQLGRSPFFA